ncbi:hypothetical protein SeMB42_g01903 [Synchytrium endobioticum]|uniref:WD repeat-containing protein 44 n=1 Tax=Synchytrium endobioticum TaxID=286115 RepID=A0A507DKZ8_9FUNG|nr:hypothetical protein SeLEV6574_g07181 [Synchytrium endobioticum]TPX51538.1 hypothetical protein SeMB42_g01903 [Synchytrium endobioticum]
MPATDIPVQSDSDMDADDDFQDALSEPDPLPSPELSSSQTQQSACLTHYDSASANISPQSISDPIPNDTNIHSPTSHTSGPPSEHVYSLISSTSQTLASVVPEQLPPPPTSSQPLPVPPDQPRDETSHSSQPLHADTHVHKRQSPPSQIHQRDNLKLHNHLVSQGLSLRQVTSHGKGAIVDEHGQPVKLPSAIKSELHLATNTNDIAVANGTRLLDPLSALVAERGGSTIFDSNHSDGESSDGDYSSIPTPTRASLHADDASVHSTISTSNHPGTASIGNSNVPDTVASKTRSMLGKLKQRASTIFHKDHIPRTSSNTSITSRPSTTTQSSHPTTTPVIVHHHDDFDTQSLASSDISTLTNTHTTKSFSKADAASGRYLKVRSNMKKTKELDRLIFVQELGAPIPGPVMVATPNLAPIFDSSLSGVPRNLRLPPPLVGAAGREGSVKEGGSISNKSSSAHTAAMGGDVSDGSTYMNGISGAIWAMRVSEDGRFLAAAGQDCAVRVWCLSGDPKYDNFSPIPSSTDACQQNSATRLKGSISSATGVSNDASSNGFRKDVRRPTDVDDLLVPLVRHDCGRNSVMRPSSLHNKDMSSRTMSFSETKMQIHPIPEESTSGSSPSSTPSPSANGNKQLPPPLPKRTLHHTFSSSSLHASGSTSPPPPLFQTRPLRVYRGHASDVLDVCWSKNGFLLSSSMDRTVRLWHISRSECLCCFQHTDFVTSIRFHPADDRYFASGSLDGRVRIWSIPDKRVERWNELPGSGFVTAVAFSHDGKFVAAGTYSGDLYLFEFNGLVYRTQVQVKSTRGRNHGKKITGIEALPPSRNVSSPEDLFLVTSNDSRVRLYNIRDMSLRRKFRGPENRNCQIHASFSDDGKFIACGSEDKCAYVWRTEPPSDAGRQMSGMLSGMLHWQLDRDFRAAEAYEKFVASDDIVTCCIFAPQKMRILLEQYGRRKKLYGIKPSSDGNVASSSSSSSSSNSNGVADRRASMSQARMSQDGADQHAAEGMVLICADRAGRIRIFEVESTDAPAVTSWAGRARVRV